MAESLTTDCILRAFDSALVADHSLESDLLVLTAAALPGLCGSEDLLAEETVNFRSLCTVVDRLRLLYFAVRPALDNFGSSELDAYFCKMFCIVPVSSSPLHLIVCAGIVAEIIDILFHDVSMLVSFNETGAENICGRLCILAVE